MMPDMSFVPVFIDTAFHFSASHVFCRLQTIYTKKTLLYHLIQFYMSHVTGPLDLSKCHTCPKSHDLLMEPLADWPNFQVQNYYKKWPNCRPFSFFFTQDCQFFYTGHRSHLNL